METRKLTKLEEGIWVKIKSQELEKLKEIHIGFLSRNAYPDFYEEIANENEIGRFQIFRFILEE